MITAIKSFQLCYRCADLTLVSNKRQGRRHGCCRYSGLARSSCCWPRFCRSGCRRSSR
ncbi:conserved hypothetical protein [Burkholderia cepacia]|nr:conserved hypothetical protein [Burkholderia cepacia]